MKLKVYRCNQCGNIITYLEEKKESVQCCGETMVEMIPGSTDAAVEKHLPVIEWKGSHVTITVGSVEHPMLEEHSIKWIMIETKQGVQCKNLTPGIKPVVEFELSQSDELVSASAYCDLHGLWKQDD